MPRLSTTGSAAMGIAGGQISIDGAVPAALAGIVGGETCWLNPTKILFQDATANVLKSYDTGTFAVATVDAAGETALGAGNNVWAAFLATTGVNAGVRTSVAGCGPFPVAGLADVAEDGTIGLITYYQLDRGVSFYSAAGVPLGQLNFTRFYPTLPMRSGILAYSVGGGGPDWRLSDFNALGITYSPRSDPINSTVPVTLASGAIWVVERGIPDNLSIRQKDANTGFLIEATMPNVLYPDAREISPGVVRVAWSTNQGESPDALIVVDVTLATGANTRGVVVAGALVFTPQTAFTPMSLPTAAPVTGGGNTGTGTRTTTVGGTLVTRRTKTAAQPITRTYPEVPRVADDAAQKSLRLIWDKVFDLNERLTASESTISAIQNTHLPAMQQQFVDLNQKVQGFAAFAGGSGAPGPAPAPDSGDSGQGDLGCTQTGPNGHVTAGTQLSPYVAGQVVCGTGNEYPALLAVAIDQPTRDANRAELLNRMIWHLNLAGFSAAHYGTNAFLLLIQIGTVQYAYRVTSYDTFETPMTTTMVFGGTTPGATTIPDGGTPD